MNVEKSRSHQDNRLSLFVRTQVLISRDETSIRSQKSSESRDSIKKDIFFDESRLSVGWERSDVVIMATVSDLKHEMCAHWIPNCIAVRAHRPSVILVVRRHTPSPVQRSFCLCKKKEKSLNFKHSTPPSCLAEELHILKTTRLALLLQLFLAFYLIVWRQHTKVVWSADNVSFCCMHFERVDRRHNDELRVCDSCSNSYRKLSHERM